jgi:hypothetical protein
LLKDYLVQVKIVQYPPLQTDDDLICDNFAKCELINDFFSEQSNLDDSNSTVFFLRMNFLILVVIHGGYLSVPL